MAVGVWSGKDGEVLDGGWVRPPIDLVLESRGKRDLESLFPRGRSCGPPSGNWIHAAVQI